jgi:hypothetical protein
MTYVYIHKRGDVPFYVGMGQGSRCISKKRRNNFHLNTWQKAEDENSFQCEIIFEGTRDECAKEEKRMIKMYGKKVDGGILCNFADGGDGGNTLTEDNREKSKKSHSIASKKMWKDEEYKQSHKEGMEKSKQLISESQKKRFSNEENRKIHSQKTQKNHFSLDDRKKLWGSFNVGRKWFHNPETGEEVLTHFDCPSGFVSGRNKNKMPKGRGHKKLIA